MDAGQLRHFVNDIIVDEPGGWKDLTEEFDRDFDERLIYMKYPNTLLFIGSGYSTLRALFVENYCTTADYRIEKYCGNAWKTVFTGVIILADVVWNLSKCSADTAITDKAVGGRILSNKDIQVFAGAGRTKNGEFLTPVPAIELEVFAPDGTYSTAKRNAYDWAECMSHLLKFISDGEIGFASSWYDSLPDDQRFALVWGLQLRTHGNDDRTPSYNFKDLFAFAWKSDDLMAGVEVDGNTITFRVEQSSYWYGTNTVATYPNVENLEQTIDADLLFARVEMGSENAIRNEGANIQYPLPYVGLRTFAEEEYALEGTCNSDNSLNLVLPFIVCTNAINEALNDKDDNDDKVFVIQYDRSMDQATQSDYLTNNGDPYLYNERFLNLNIINRWNLPAAGITYYSDIDASFQAEYTVGPSAVSTAITNTGVLRPQVLTNRWQFDNDYTAPNFDIGNNWGNGTTQGNPVSQANSRYTAPTQGFYVFDTLLRTQITNVVEPDFDNGQPNPPFQNWHIWLWTATIVRHFDSGGTLINTYRIPDWTAGLVPLSPPRRIPGIYEDARSQQVYMNANDYVEVGFVTETYISAVGSSYGITPTAAPNYPFGSSGYPGPSTFVMDYSVLNGSYVKTRFVATFGGQINEPDPDAYYSTQLEFTKEVDEQTWDILKGDFSSRIQVAPDAVTFRRAYLRTASRKVHSGETEVKTIGNRKQPNV